MRPEKQLLLNEVKEKIEAAPSFLVARYQGLTAERAQAFRNEVRKTGGDFEVVKKRLLVKAASAIDVALDLELLGGHIGVVVTGDDPIGTTKAVFNFGKDHERAVDVLVGKIEGVLYGAREVEQLSKLPSQDQMRAQFLSLLEAPMQQTLGAMNALLTSVIYCLEEKAKQEA